MIWLVVVLISYVVVASDECAGVRTGPIECYECSTYKNQPYCGDPFNDTTAGLVTELCDGVCLKWILKPKYGGIHFVRTCSKNIQLHIPIAMVCMQESRPGDGKLCLCDDHRCNGSTTIHGASVLLLLSILTAVGLLLPGYLLADTCGVPNFPSARDSQNNDVICEVKSHQILGKCRSEYRKRSHLVWTGHKLVT